MRLTEAQAQVVSGIETARSRRDRQERILRDLVVHAAATGVPIAHVAAAAGVTRQTAYRWLGESRAALEDEGETMQDA